MDTAITCPHCRREFDAGKIIFDRVREEAKLAAQEENAKEAKRAAEEAFRKGKQAADEEKQSKLTQAQQALAELRSKMQNLESENQEKEAKMRKMQGDIDEANRNAEKLADRAKANQKFIGNGSAQYDGLAQEEFIAEVVRTRFGDEAEQSGIGENGADILQTVRHEGENCGTIYYESKSASNGFKMEWVEKFKKNLRKKGSNLGVIVTDAKPGTRQKQKIKELKDIWVCNLQEFENLIIGLRYALIRTKKVVETQRGKDYKDELYEYISSDEFQRDSQSIVDNCRKVIKLVEAAQGKLDEALNFMRKSAGFDLVHTRIRNVINDKIAALKAA